MQPHDCTQDVMMVFCKEGVYDMSRALQLSAVPEPQPRYILIFLGVFFFFFFFCSAASRIAEAVPKV